MPTPDPDLDPAAIRRTGELMSRARRLLAYGGLDGIVQRPLRHSGSGVYPQFAVAAQGYELVDSTGQVFLDWANGWGPVVLGHRHPAVEKAIRDQLSAGPTLSLMHPVEVECAELIAEMVPCAEMVAFGKNGSDAVNAAVRVARSVTGRDLVVQYGFHGFHEWIMCLHPGAHGIPKVLRKLVHPFPYNDLQALERVLRKHRRHVAAVVMEPSAQFLPEPGFLDGVRELAHRHGALLVFDEIVTGFRFARGGAQECFGVVPDLVALGKAMANGMPLSAIAGRREYMQKLPSTGFGMTFRGETLSLAAARATLRMIRDEPVCEHLAKVGEAVRTSYNDACAERGVRCELSGHPARMSFLFRDTGRLRWTQVRDLLVRECLKRGMITNGTLLPTYAMDQRAVERTLDVLNGVLDVLVDVERGGDRRNERPFGGSPFGLRCDFASGFLDRMAPTESGLDVEGWILLEDGPPDSIELILSDGTRVAAEGVERPDVARAMPQAPGADRAGFRASISAPTDAGETDWEFVLCALRGSQVAFRCHVVRTRHSSDSGSYWLGDGVLYV